MVTLHRPTNANWKLSVYGAEGQHAVPHYHIEGPGFRCSIDILTNGLIVGDAPRRILAEARAWAETNRQMLVNKYEELNP